MLETDDDLNAELEALRARVAASVLSDKESARAKLLAELAEAKAEALAAEKVKRDLVGRELEAAARKVAGNKYLVRYVDLASMLPDADPSTLPGDGVLVVRSPPTQPIDALAAFFREVEANERALPDIYTDLLCLSVVHPDVSGTAGVAFRAFFETSLARGTVIGIGDQAADLGGVRGKKAKRGRQ